MGKNIKFKWVKTPEQIKNGLGLGEQFNKYFAERCYTYMYDYTPYRTGLLAGSVRVQNEIRAYEDYATIWYPGPYAHRIYEGTHFNFNKEIHPKATAHWDKAMWVVEKDKIIKEMDNYRRRISK